jgi:prevent-host-death family protein
MRLLEISKDIVPLGEFKAKAASIIRALQGRRNPLIITQNGRPACVVMSPMEFDRMREREAFFDALSEGMADIEAGRVTDDEQLGELLEAEFGPLEAE